MAKSLTVDLALCFVIIAVFTDEIMLQSPNLCRSNSICIERRQCLALLTSQNSSIDGLFFSCSNNTGWVCCPVGSAARMLELNLEDNMKLLPVESCGFSAENRIFHGQEAFIGQFPWMALIGQRSNGTSGSVEYECGGTLINNRYVLTAAHCLQHGDTVHVRLGELDLSKEPDCDEENYCADPPVNVEVEEIILHPKFNEPLLKNDIALLRLKRNVSRTEYIAPICLPFGINITGEERKKSFVVAGWGKVHRSNLTGSTILLHTRVNNVPVSTCNEAQPREVRPIGALQLCAGFNGVTDVCKGDSGGPLMETKVDAPGSTRTYQLGIVSFGFGLCGRDVPSVYTRVTAYLTWILSHLKP